MTKVLLFRREKDSFALKEGITERKKWSSKYNSLTKIMHDALWHVQVQKYHQEWLGDEYGLFDGFLWKM